MLLVSVIIPSYNHALFLKERIESVLLQTYANFEIIILDDASTDNSKEILEKYKFNKKVSHLIYNKKNSGSAFGQWAQGIDLAKGEWIWIAESDDIASPSFLEKCVAIQEKNNDVGLCYCNSYILDERNEIRFETHAERKNTIFDTDKWSHYYLKNGIDEINENLKYESSINNVSAVIFKKELSLDILSDLKKFKYYGDWYFFLRLLMKSDVGYIHESLNTHRFHVGSHLGSHSFLLKSKIEYFQIFRLLYLQPKIENKKYLLSFFTYNNLSFGIKEDGIKTGYNILKGYCEVDWKLAIKVILKICSIKLSMKHYRSKFDLIDKENKR